LFSMLSLYPKPRERFIRSFSSMSMICAASSIVRCRKHIILSMRFKNSGANTRSKAS
jgi:hypothetical protein